MDVRHPPVVEIDRRGEARAARRGVRMPGHPQEDLRVLGKHGTQRRRRLGHEIGLVHLVVVTVERAFQRCVEEHEGRPLAVAREFLPEPVDLRRRNLGQMAGRIGRQEDQRVITHRRAVMDAREAKGFAEAAQPRLAFFGIAADRLGALLEPGIDEIVVADHRQQGFRQRLKKRLDRRILGRRTVAFAQVAHRHHGLDVAPGIDRLQHLCLERQIVPRQVHVAEDDQMVWCRRRRACRRDLGQKSAQDQRAEGFEKGALVVADHGETVGSGKCRMIRPFTPRKIRPALGAKERSPVQPSLRRRLSTTARSVPRPRKLLAPKGAPARGPDKGRCSDTPAPAGG